MSLPLILKLSRHINGLESSQAMSGIKGETDLVVGFCSAMTWPANLCSRLVPSSVEFTTKQRVIFLFLSFSFDSLLSFQFSLYRLYIISFVRLFVGFLGCRIALWQRLNPRRAKENSAGIYASVSLYFEQEPETLDSVHYSSKNLAAASVFS
jgi:hypothetical protein